MFFTLISGTNRLQSSTRKLSSHIENIFRRFLTPTDQIEILDLASLPAETFHPDSYVHTPKSFSKFSDLVLKANGIFSVVPEYNGSAPGAFKYFVDLLPFPKALLHKPSGFVGLSAGRFGALRAVEHLQQVFEYRNAFVYPERVFIPFIDKALDTNGKPLDEKVDQLLESEVKGFIEFTKKLSKV